MVEEGQVHRFPGRDEGASEALAVLEREAAGRRIEALPDLSAALARIQGLISVRYAAAAQEAIKAGQAAPGDRLLTAADAAERLAVSEDWLYHHYSTLPFARKVGPQQLRFSEAGLELWIRESGSAKPAARSPRAGRRSG